MHKVINGKVYDSDTADLIGEYCDYRVGHDFNAVRETLYRTKKGAFFIVGEGYNTSFFREEEINRKIIYGVSGNGGTSFGSNMFALTSDEACKWLEARACTSRYEGQQYEDVFEPEEA